jgi:hypothetical protein
MIDTVMQKTQNSYAIRNTFSSFTHKDNHFDGDGLKSAERRVELVNNF